MCAKFILIIALFITLGNVQAKILKKAFQLQSLVGEPSTVFLAKFDIGLGRGNFSINYRYSKTQNRKSKGEFEIDFDKVNLRIGLLRDDRYLKFKSLPTCVQRQKLYEHMHEIEFARVSYASNSFKIDDQQQEHIWYLYIYDCKSNLERKELKGTLNIQITMYNNDSHFGEDEKLLVSYIILMTIAIVLAVRYFIPITKMKHRGLSFVQICMYLSFPTLFLSYLYRLINLAMVNFYGEDVWFLVYLYTTLKYLVEGIMVTVIVSISWGWSLIHLKHQAYYSIIGVIVTIINLIGIILDISADEIEEVHHQYDRVVGSLLLGIRLLILLIFIAGILRITAQSVGKRRHFIRKFAVFGLSYLAAWPLAVIFAEVFLPNYMHNEVVTVIEEGVYIIVNGYLCNLFTFPDSDFKKVSVKDDEDSLPDYVNRSYF